MGLYSLKNTTREKISKANSGPAHPLTTQEQIDLLTVEIEKKQHSIEYYESKGLTALVESIRAFIVRKVAERAKLKKQLEQERILQNITPEAHDLWLAGFASREEE